MAKPSDLPEWDTTQVNAIEPTQNRKEEGWLAPGGVPEKPPFQTFNYWQNEVYRWLKSINDQGILDYDNLTDYVANVSYAVGSDGVLYKCLVNNGPSSSVVDPVGDTTGTWVDLSIDARMVTVSGPVTIPDGARYAIIEASAAGGSGSPSGDGDVGGDTTVTATNVSITATGGQGGRALIKATDRGGTFSGSAIDSTKSGVVVGGGSPGGSSNAASHEAFPGKGGYVYAYVDLSGITTLTIAIGAGGAGTSSEYTGSNGNVKITWIK